MRFHLFFIFVLLIVSCQSVSEKKSESALEKGIRTLTNFSENGEPDYEKALIYFDQATTLNPDNIRARYWKADTEVQLGNLNNAFKTATTTLNKTSIEGNKLQPSMLVMAGVLSIKLGKNPDQYFREALRLYQKRINRNINDVDAIAQKAIVLCYMGRKDEAIRFLNGISLNDENQTMLAQIKNSIKSFDVNSVLDELTIEDKERMPG